MQEFSGTNGPWEVFKNDGEDMVIQSGSLERGGGWIGYTCIAAEFQNEKDALLIAAAPELLELVMLANGQKGCHTVSWQEKAKEAIAKALGQ
jgi:hypothetical protein